MTPPLKPSDLRTAIANRISDESAYEVADYCVTLGLEPPTGEENPWNGKYKYAERKLRRCTPEELMGIAQRIIDDRNAPELEELVAWLTGGVTGELKNLIFAALGLKPEIVLRDATTNDIEVTEGLDRCLVYDRALGSGGLSWGDLVDWYRDKHMPNQPNLQDVSHALWSRLHQSLGKNDPERLLHRTYSSRYASQTTPALIPQVFLHFDPYLRHTKPRPSAVWRQRMDFLLLLPGRRRVVLEIDGKRHYAKDDQADAAAYARMVAEDRRLQLTGYEVFRFGGAEFMRPDSATAMLDSFFDELLAGASRPHL
jgi:hypothetical protein